VLCPARRPRTAPQESHNEQAQAELAHHSLSVRPCSAFVLRGSEATSRAFRDRTPPARQLWQPQCSRRRRRRSMHAHSRARLNHRRRPGLAPGSGAAWDTMRGCCAAPMSRTRKLLQHRPRRHRSRGRRAHAPLRRDPGRARRGALCRCRRLPPGRGRGRGRCFCVPCCLCLAAQQSSLSRWP